MVFLMGLDIVTYMFMGQMFKSGTIAQTLHQLSVGSGTAQRRDLALIASAAGKRFGEFLETLAAGS